MTVRLTLVLHEDDVPYLNDLRVILVDELTTGLGSLLLRAAAVEVYLRTWTTRSRVAHLPEVVMLVAIDDMVCWDVLEPKRRSLIVALEILALVTLEDRDIEVSRIELQDIDEIFPCHINGTLLKIVTERPVAQHLKHRMVVRVVSHLLKVVVLAADAETLLSIRTSARLRVASTQDYVLPLVHASVGKHESRVVLDDHRCAWHNSVPLALKEPLEGVTNFICSHICVFYYFFSL